MYVLINELLWAKISAKLPNITNPSTQYTSVSEEKTEPPWIGISNPYSCLRIRKPFLLYVTRVKLRLFRAHRTFCSVARVRGSQPRGRRHMGENTPTPRQLQPAPRPAQSGPCKEVLYLTLSCLPFPLSLSKEIIETTVTKTELMAVTMRTATTWHVPSARHDEPLVPMILLNLPNGRKKEVPRLSRLTEKETKV